MKTVVTGTRWTTLAAAGALLAALAVGGGTPALAASPAAPAATASATASPLPPLDAAAVRQSIAGLPNADVNGALVQVKGRAGEFEGASGEALSVDGRFRVGSISKVFTATVVLQLAAEHRLDLDGTVQRYLPGVLPAEFPPIKVGQLLDHTSGLPRGTGGAWGDGTAASFAAHRFVSWTPQQVVATLAGQTMSFEPGTAQQYNGMNTFVAGMLIEKVTGHSYAHEVRHRIIQPLGLHDTSVPDARDPRLADPAARAMLTVTDPDGTSHRVDVTEQSPWPWAEGGLISSAPDLDRFITALFRGRLLPPAQQEKLFTVPDVPNHQSSHCNTGPTAGRACMSMGLESVQINGVTVWGKTGSRPGWTNGVFATRDLSRRVVYSLNPTGLDGAESAYILRIANAVFAPARQP
ncbi:serine hydrolase domain-containing protein [Kitasatospora atroaurantiaca]|uniref:D-alanyl-D-alanine carboxypeptidase n=1 Tax=Kitasatospora atroaurantiaca TaxID=285545 RepID=A0A561F1X1_9ACTN|nr:serine hydrolase domain-containing protein [Kitasatospora atroaurantiaca]TWE21858.1 D-alanyl-D-alanine carboxypeptidase [Kitasatospora atroaurantiaca]